MAIREQVVDLGHRFGEAFYTHLVDPARLTELPSLTIGEAYLAQEVAINYRQKRGETPVGYKVGCTSASIRQQLGLTEPYYAVMTAPHVTAEKELPLDWQKFVNLAIEPELVIELGSDIDPNLLSDECLVGAISRVSVGIELHHFKFWLGKPTAQELIISNGLWAGLVMGTKWVSPRGLDFKTEEFRLRKNGVVLSSGAAKEIMGGPLESLRWLATKLHERGTRLKAGQYIIPGSPVALARIEADGDLTAEIAKVGNVTIRFRAEKK